jgi:HD superfamily phosphohydrolase
MREYHRENLCFDPLHGYIPFTSSAELDSGEVSERQIIDHPWLQRMRHIRQLQTAWWVYPTAEHTRFQHILGVMHLASRAVGHLYESLAEVCRDVPSRGYIESLLRMAGLLHDVGHGPFGHFFDEHFLRSFGETHETIGAEIIRRELAPLLSRIRRNPNSQLSDGETLDPAQIAWLITRPKKHEAAEQPRWLVMLRGLLSGIYTIDNMDFVLRDAYMSGYSQQAYDLQRLLHYTFFSERGLTIHDRGVDSLLRFMSARAELFRNIYFHRTVRAIDLALKDLFIASRERLFPGNPREHLEQYLGFHESSLMVDVDRWADAADPALQALGQRWRSLLRREVPWTTICTRPLVFRPGQSEETSIFGDSELVEKRLRDRLPPELRQMELHVDLPRMIYRPYTHGPAAGQNFLYDAALQQVRPLNDHELFRNLPGAQRLCRVYAKSTEHAVAITAALDSLLIGSSADDATNM